MLEKFGFSQYESQVYEAIISAECPVEASAVAKLSGVPKAKVYEVISRLLDKGILLDSVIEKKKVYKAISIEQVIKKLTLKFQSDIEQLKNVKKKKIKPDDRVWNLATEESIYAYSLALIDGAQKTINISTWKEIFLVYQPLLEEKERQGVLVEAHVVGELESSLRNLSNFVPHESQTGLKKFQNIVVDGAEVVFAITEGADWHSIATQSEQLVDVFRDFFYRDIILTFLEEKYRHILHSDDEYVGLINKLRY
ncbi:TrmB family transcriptional regulator [Gibbsiella quercinecans]|uniref:TrmB family transcriptional regulator n=1 Tax=Gibbsiella quercinecans TaxID=929813 RepID=UPI000EF282CC|nr:TrmB family transcriptional regulator [Gibbsiella quercinecans]RLM13800.1 TrmB family transcriptional regulator [Gibbsiella quercinecans]